MKANEAPEKLYFGEFDKTALEAYSNREPNDEIEYTRTDAFIEKACEFLANDANIPLWEGYNDTFGCVTELLIKNFKNYMKGE